MELREEKLEPVVPAPRTLRFCKRRRKETPHEIRMGGGVVARICIPCLEESLQYELDRD